METKLLIHSPDDNKQFLQVIDWIKRKHPYTIYKPPASEKYETLSKSLASKRPPYQNTLDYRYFYISAQFKSVLGIQL